MSLATLGMYDLPEFRDATDGWWEVLARAFEEEGVEGVPPELRRGEDSYHKAWTDPRLLFSQTCGYPLRLMLKDKVRYVATPCYNAPGCSGAYYRSAIVVRKDSDCTEIEGLRGKICAYNSQSSQSGYNCLRAKIAPHAEKGRFFSRTVQSGGHHASLQMVATGKADVAAIDCVTLTMIGDFEPDLVGQIRILDYTARAPGLPYVTSGQASDELIARLRRGLASALSDPEAQPHLKKLRISGLEVLEEDVYDSIAEMEDRAHAQGYPAVA